MHSVKEQAGNVAASAKSGLEKSKAIAQEKVEKLTANNELEKEMATEKMQDRKHNAEVRKQETREHNAAARQEAAASKLLDSAH